MHKGSTRELSDRRLEELPQAGHEANESQWHSACLTGPSHVPSCGTQLQRLGSCWQGGSSSFHLPGCLVQALLSLVLRAGWMHPCIPSAAGKSNSRTA